MSERLRQFLSAYLTWADAGAPDTNGLMRSQGLCGNLNFYAAMHGWEEVWNLEFELEVMFKEDGLCLGYPFGLKVYLEEAETLTHHENQERLNWVRRRLNVEN